MRTYYHFNENYKAASSSSTMAPTSRPSALPLTCGISLDITFPLSPGPLAPTSPTTLRIISSIALGEPFDTFSPLFYFLIENIYHTGIIQRSTFGNFSILNTGLNKTKRRHAGFIALLLRLL
jgi:hypothetical protein